MQEGPLVTPYLKLFSLNLSSKKHTSRAHLFYIKSSPVQVLFLLQSCDDQKLDEGLHLSPFYCIMFYLRLLIKNEAKGSILERCLLDLKSLRSLWAEFCFYWSTFLAFLQRLGSYSKVIPVKLFTVILTKFQEVIEIPLDTKDKNKLIFYC